MVCLPPSLGPRFGRVSSGPVCPANLCGNVTRVIARRRLLGTATVGTAGVLITSGCQPPSSDGPDRTAPNRDRGNGESRSDQDGPPERPDPDLPLLTELITAERETIDAYRATLDAFPELSGWYREQMGEHERHLRVLRELFASARKSASGGSEPTPSDPPRAAEPPGDRAEAVRTLRKHEQRSANARDDRLTRAHGGRLARLIASIAASDQLHAERIAEEGP